MAYVTLVKKNNEPNLFSYQFAAYSALGVLSNGTVVLLYETDFYGDLTLAYLN